MTGLLEIGACVDTSPKSGLKVRRLCLARAFSRFVAATLELALEQKVARQARDSGILVCAMPVQPHMLSSGRELLPEVGRVVCVEEVPFDAVLVLLRELTGSITLVRREFGPAWPQLALQEVR